MNDPTGDATAMKNENDASTVSKSGSEHGF
jgi:hypothetical protein